MTGNIMVYYAQMAIKVNLFGIPRCPANHCTVKVESIWYVQSTWWPPSWSGIHHADGA